MGEANIEVMGEFELYKIVFMRQIHVQLMRQIHVQRMDNFIKT